MILQENVKYSCNTCFSTKCKTETSVSAQRMHECKWSGMLKFSLCDWKSLLQKCMMFKPACPPKVPGFPNLGQSWEEQVEAKRGIWVRLFFASWNFEYDHPKGRHPEKMLLFFWILSKLPSSLSFHQLVNLYNFFWTPKTSIKATFTMTHYPKFYKDRILALLVIYTT